MKFLMIHKSFFVLCLALSLGFVSVPAQADDMNELVGTWVGELTTIARPSDVPEVIKLAKMPAMFDVVRRGEGDFECYLTTGGPSMKLDNVSYNEGVLQFDFGVAGFVAFAPVQATITDGTKMEFVWKSGAVEGGSINVEEQTAEFSFVKQNPVTLSDEQLSGTYRGVLKMGLEYTAEALKAGERNSPAKLNVVLAIKVEGEEASAHATLTKTGGPEAEPEAYRKQEFEFKRIERFGSRLFLQLRNEQEEEERLGQIYAKRPNMDRRLGNILQDTFHLWIGEDGQARLMVSAYVGDAQGTVVKDPPEDEVAAEGDTKKGEKPASATKKKPALKEAAPGAK